jgi:GNAT superfamily N-acetyltransferase
MMSIRRIADGDDIERAGALVQMAYRALPDYPADDTYDRYIGDIAARLDEADVIVAVLDERIVGCLTFVPAPGTHHHEFDDPDAASFRYFGVDPEVQGAGVGRSMVQWCIDEARRLGRQRIRLHTIPVMTAAQRLYARMGFVRTPEFDEVWGDVEGIAYVLDL